MERGARETGMWGQLAIDSFLRPRSAARQVLALPIGPVSVVQAAGAVTCIGLVLGYLGLRLSGGAIDPISASVLSMPLLGAAIQFGVMALVAALTFRIGRMFGGAGGFWGAAAIVVWLNAVTLAIQLVQLAALAVVPPFAGLIAIATLFWLLWAYANFVTELHGFASPVMVLGVVVLTVIVIVFGLTMLVAILGLSPQGA